MNNILTVNGGHKNGRPAAIIVIASSPSANIFATTSYPGLPPIFGLDIRGLGAIEYLQAFIYSPVATWTTTDVATVVDANSTAFTRLTWFISEGALQIWKSFFSQRLLRVTTPNSDPGRGL